MSQLSLRKDRSCRECVSNWLFCAGKTPPSSPNPFPSTSIVDVESLQLALKPGSSPGCRGTGCILQPSLGSPKPGKGCQHFYPLPHGRALHEPPVTNNFSFESILCRQLRQSLCWPENTQFWFLQL